MGFFRGRPTEGQIRAWDGVERHAYTTPRYGLWCAFTASSSWRGVGNRAAYVTAPHSSEEVAFTTSDMVPRLVQSQTWKPCRYPNKRRRLVAESDKIWTFGQGMKSTHWNAGPEPSESHPDHMIWSSTSGPEPG